MSQLKEVQAAMGAIVFSFQQLEWQLIEVLYAIIDQPTIDLIKVLQTKFEFGRSMDLLKAVAKKRITDTDIVSELEAIVDKASNFAKERNTLVHSHYHVLDSSGRTLIIEGSGTRLKSMDHKKLALVPENLFELADNINKTIREAETLYEGVIQYFNYDPADDEAYQLDGSEMSREDLDLFFRTEIGDLSHIDTSGLFLLGKRTE